MCLRNTTHKSNWDVATSSFLQFPEEKKKKKKADVLCFVFPRFGQKWRSFTTLSIDWPRTDFCFLRIVKTMWVHNSYQACHWAFNQLPAIACWVTQGFTLWQTASPWWLSVSLVWLFRFHAHQLIHTPEGTNHLPSHSLSAPSRLQSNFSGGVEQSFTHFS